MFRRGAVIGKFYPFHLGHKYLLDYAQSNSLELNIIVCWNRNESIPPEIRYEWIRNTYPKANIFLVEDKDYDQNDSKLWAKLTKKWLRFVPDAVFTSENYGKLWSQYLGCENVEVDVARKVVPVSGTKIRNNPIKYWDYMLPEVRSYFAKKICIVGAESTGKSTLALDLARRLQTVWVPEYGRTHWEARLPKGEQFIWSEKDFIKICEEQNKQEDELLVEANKVLICDTDAFATSIWFERYMNYDSKVIQNFSEKREPDLYILTDVNTPFEDDGTRDGEHLRDWMHQRFIEELDKKSIPYVIVSGTRKERVGQASIEISKLLLNK